MESGKKATLFLLAELIENNKGGDKNKTNLPAQSDNKNDKPEVYHNAGRKTVYSDELKNQICDLILEGQFIKTACKIVGISTETYYRWMKQGKNGIEPFNEFYDAITAADGLAERHAVNEMQRVGKRDWKQWAAYLSTRFRKSGWGQVDYERELLAQTNNINIQILTNDAESREMLKVLYRKQMALAAQSSRATDDDNIDDEDDF